MKLFMYKLCKALIALLSPQYVGDYKAPRNFVWPLSIRASWSPNPLYRYFAKPQLHGPCKVTGGFVKPPGAFTSIPHICRKKLKFEYIGVYEAPTGFVKGLKALVPLEAPEFCEAP